MVKKKSPNSRKIKKSSVKLNIYFFFLYTYKSFPIKYEILAYRVYRSGCTKTWN